MKRIIVAFAVVTLLSIGMSTAAGAAAPRLKPALRPAVLALAVTPLNLPAAGGQVTLVARIRDGLRCTFGGSKAVTKPCVGASVVGQQFIEPNSSFSGRRLRLWILVRGQHGGAARRFAFVAEGGRPVPTTTTTTTTTLPPKPSTTCTGACGFSFPQASWSGVVSVALNSVTQNVPCPDPGVCDATSAQQIDDVNVTVCAGSSGDSDVTGQIGDFSLALSNGTQGSSDSVTFDGSVSTAFGNYGAVAPNQCVTGDMYFDVPIGVTWTSLNYVYTSADFSTQTVYVWNA